MNKTEFWKNFNLGKELEIAGSFIYNGLKVLDNMGHFYYEEEVFEFLYDISVGIERLQKIVIILSEHNEKLIQEEFEKSLITHNHMYLMERITKKYKVNIQNPHNAYLQLLSEFYRSWRYDRYTLKEAYLYDKERKALVDYLQKYLKMDIEYKELFSITKNDNRIKKFLGKITGKICSELYELVCKCAWSQNIYTYEIRTNSKAYKIFMRKEYDFIYENIVWKEILLYFMNNEGEYSMLNLMKNLIPLNLDPALVNEYIRCFKSDSMKTYYIDEIEMLYEEIEDKRERLELLEVLDNPNIIWDYELGGDNDFENNE